MTDFANWTLASAGGRWVELGLSIFSASVTLRVLTEADGAISLLLAAVLGGGAVLAAHPHSVRVVAAAASVGVALHLLGDLVTTEWLRPLLPLSRRSAAVPVIGSTDHWRERAAGAVCGLAGRVPARRPCLPAGTELSAGHRLRGALDDG